MFVKKSASVAISFCFLMYLLEVLLENKPREVLPNYTLMRLKEELSTIKLIPIQVDQSNSNQPLTWYLKLTEIFKSSSLDYRYTMIPDRNAFTSKEIRRVFASLKMFRK